jgi:hypothetical protein
MNKVKGMEKKAREEKLMEWNSINQTLFLPLSLSSPHQPYSVALLAFIRKCFFVPFNFNYVVYKENKDETLCLKNFPVLL